MTVKIYSVSQVMTLRNFDSIEDAIKYSGIDINTIWKIESF